MLRAPGRHVACVASGWAMGCHFCPDEDLQRFCNTGISVRLTTMVPDTYAAAVDLRVGTREWLGAGPSVPLLTLGLGSPAHGKAPAIKELGT